MCMLKPSPTMCERRARLESAACPSSCSADATAYQARRPLRSSRKRWPRPGKRPLERPQPDVLELHRAGAVLQRDGATGVFVVLDVHRLLAVDQHDQPRAPGSDVLGV